MCRCPSSSQLTPAFREVISAGKELVLQYDIEMGYLVLSQGSRILVKVGGWTMSAEEPALPLAKSLGDIEGYMLPTIKDTEVVSLEEEQDSIFAFVIVNPSHRE
jgi:hypothetical protein